MFFSLRTDYEGEGMTYEVYFSVRLPDSLRLNLGYLHSSSGIARQCCLLQLISRPFHNIENSLIRFVSEVSGK